MQHSHSACDQPQQIYQTIEQSITVAMSAKLDMALDDVVMTERTARRRGRGGRRVPTAGRKATAPVGGIQKNTKATKGPMKPVIPNGLASGGRESKIIVSNLVGLPRSFST